MAFLAIQIMVCHIRATCNNLDKDVRPSQDILDIVEKALLNPAEQ